MENKKIFAGRMIYAALFVLSLVYISCSGGNLPYMLFFLMVVNMVLSVIYILYVYSTIKISQDIPERRVTKKEPVPYRLNLCNEGLVAYRDVRLQFLKGLSEVNGQAGLGNMGLEPGEKTGADMELYCKYSGIYYVGVDTIEIMDYFKIFRIRFPMPQKMKVTVKPRILKPDNLAFITEEEECRSSGQTGREDFLADSEVRKYQAGDNKRLIHWKNSAKRQELMVRKMAVEELSEFVVFMDGRVSEKEFESRIIVCDKLREAVIALVYYIYSLGYPVLTVLDVKHEKEVSSKRDFDEFYRMVTDYVFDTETGFEERLSGLDREVQEGIPFVIVSAKQEWAAGGTWEAGQGVRNIHMVDLDAFQDNGRDE